MFYPKQIRTQVQNKKRKTMSESWRNRITYLSRNGCRVNVPKTRFRGSSSSKALHRSNYKHPNIIQRNRKQYPLKLRYKTNLIFYRFRNRYKINDRCQQTSLAIEIRYENKPNERFNLQHILLITSKLNNKIKIKKNIY